MYKASVTALLGILPAASVLYEKQNNSTLTTTQLVAKWFSFWAVGVRLFTAGIKQLSDPTFTQSILGVGDDAQVVIKELGIANFSNGLIGILGLFRPAWQTAASLAGGVFYTLAGINHARQPHRNDKEDFAMWTDLGIGALLLATVGKLFKEE